MAYGTGLSSGPSTTPLNTPEPFLCAAISCAAASATSSTIIKHKARLILSDLVSRQCRPALFARSLLTRSCAHYLPVSMDRLTPDVRSYSQGGTAGESQPENSGRVADVDLMGSRSTCR